MHDVLRARVMRKIETLPEEQVYQVLDYIEFLETRYSAAGQDSRPGGFQKLGEEIEDRMRKGAFKPSHLREAFQVIAAADRAFSGVRRAGRQLFDEIAGRGGAEGRGPEERAAGSGRSAEAGGRDEPGERPPAGERGAEEGRRRDD